MHGEYRLFRQMQSIAGLTDNLPTRLVILRLRLIRLFPKFFVQHKVINYQIPSTHRLAGSRIGTIFKRAFTEINRHGSLLTNHYISFVVLVVICIIFVVS
jgi:hypothetical protein